MAALQYADIPGYAALILRRTLPDLNQADALIPRSKEWLTGTDADWNERNREWTIPTQPRGFSTLKFGYLESYDDVYQYQGAAYQYIGWDELTQFQFPEYRYMFSRLRRTTLLKGQHVPLRMRAASNPGGRGHDWVKQRFLIEGPANGRVFVPAKLSDNPAIDADEYIEALGEMDPLDIQQLLDGNWEVTRGGAKFSRRWMEGHEYGRLPSHVQLVRTLRLWDVAATEPRKPTDDPDYTVGTKYAEDSTGRFWILDIVRFRGSPETVERRIKDVTDADGHTTHIRVEQEGGALAKIALDMWGRTIFRGYTYQFNRPPGKDGKEVRANPFFSACQAGLVNVIRGEHLTTFYDEAEQFPYGKHDDIIDSLSHGHFALTSRRPAKRDQFASVVPISRVA